MMGVDCSEMLRFFWVNNRTMAHTKELPSEATRQDIINEEEATLDEESQEENEHSEFLDSD